MDDHTVIGRVTAILEVVAGPHPCSLARLAAETGIPKPTVRRIANQLVAERILSRDAHGYRLGLRLIELGTAATTQLGTAEAAAPFVQELHERTRQIAWIAAFDEDALITLDTAYPHEHAPLVAATWQPRWAIGPAAVTAAGHLMLSLRPAEADRVLRAGLTRLTPHTVTSPRLLHGRLQRVADTGIAYECEETRLGWWCGAALVHAPTGTYVLGLISPVRAVPMTRGITHLQRAAERLQHELTSRPGRQTGPPTRASSPARRWTPHRSPS
ncbi:IclR family transcriptional regulator [Streptomyces sp. NPDC049040]|uniref:IclR family transcriptional regulator n=1 Tax=Streptomyces sp. NPDC049040 TaxID=3365593 RepID=UPI003712C803